MAHLSGRPTRPALRRPTAPGALRVLTLAAGFAFASGCERAAVERPAGGGAPEPEVFEPVMLTDAAGRTHDVQAPPQRIVSLVPSATAILVALGEEDRLVARTDFDTAQALADLPTIGGGLQPNLEVLLPLEADLVIRFHGPSDPGTAEQLDRVGATHFAVRPDGIADVLFIIEQMGALTGRTRAAASLAGRIESELESVREMVAPYPPVRTAFVMGGTPPWAAGAGTFIHELIRIAGGVNVFADLTGLYAPISPEQLVARNADVYLLLEGTQLDERVTRGVRIREVSANVQLPGPGIGQAALEVARALHPQQLP